MDQLQFGRFNHQKYWLKHASRLIHNQNPGLQPTITALMVIVYGIWCVYMCLFVCLFFLFNWSLQKRGRGTEGCQSLEILAAGDLAYFPSGKSTTSGIYRELLRESKRESKGNIFPAFFSRNVWSYFPKSMQKSLAGHNCGVPWCTNPRIWRVFLYWIINHPSWGSKIILTHTCHTPLSISCHRNGFATLEFWVNGLFFFMD